MNALAFLAICCGLWAIVATAVATHCANRADNLELQNDALRDDAITYRFAVAALEENMRALEARRHVILRRWWKRTSYRRLARLPRRITV